MQSSYRRAKRTGRGIVNLTRHAAPAAALAILCVHATARADVPDPGDFVVPNHVVSTANNAPLIRFNRNLSGGAHTHGAWNGGWQVPLALAAWGGNTASDAKLLQQINYNLQGGNSISANGGYPAQHETNVTGMYAVLRQSDRFWNDVLTADQRHKIDLVMTAAIIGSAYTTADATYAGGHQHTALDGDTNLNRGWNPNYREGMFGNLLQGMVYFGGADAVTNILANYDHTAFVAQLQAAGLSNTAETFTWAANHPGSGAPSASKIEDHVRDYRFQGQGLMDPFELYEYLTLHTYGRDVIAGLNNGAGRVGGNGVRGGMIVSGAANLPNLGEPGMLLEFNGVDAGGPRSSISYAYHGFKPNLTNHLSVLIGGYWQEGVTADELLALLDVGVTDLEYKLEHGYRNFAHGNGTNDVFDINRSAWDWSFRTHLPLWNEVLRPYHFGEAAEPLPEPEPTPPADGPVTSSAGWQSFGLGDEHTQPIVVTFDVTPNADNMDGLVGLSRGQPTAWPHLAAIIRFNTSGHIDVRDGNVYTADLDLPYDASDTFLVRMVIDPATQTYSVYITPEVGDEILLAAGYGFRSEQAATDMLDHWATWSGQGSLTVDNFTIVPEPTTLALLALGGATLLIRRRTRA
ncbi:MAG: PEP-CTERM sorting domain-containing protein [Phycisphaeraceae bacterium]